MMGGDSEILDGGAMCVIPCCQIVQLMDLSLMSLHIETPEKHPTAGQRPGVVYTKDGVPIQVTSVAQVRIGPPPEIGGDDSEAALPSVLAVQARTGTFVRSQRRSLIVARVCVLRSTEGRETAIPEERRQHLWRPFAPRDRQRDHADP